MTKMKDGGAVTQSFSRKEKPTEADIAYETLKTQGSPMHYIKLTEEILRRLGIVKDAARIAAVLTQINLDTRFSYSGRGEWSLKEWEAVQGAKRPTPVAELNKETADEEDGAELDDLDEDVLLEEDILETDEIFAEPEDEEKREDKW